MIRVVTHHLTDKILNYDELMKARSLFYRMRKIKGTPRGLLTRYLRYDGSIVDVLKPICEEINEEMREVDEEIQRRNEGASVLAGRLESSKGKFEQSKKVSDRIF